VTTVPGVVPGAGVGLSERKRGWMWDSFIEGLVGRDEGMNVRFEYVDCAVGGRSWRERAVVGLSRMEEAGDAENGGGSRNGPSRAFAGLAGLDPGIVSSVRPRLGMVGDRASRIEGSTLDVSQLSKPSDWAVVAMDRVSESTLESLDNEDREARSAVFEFRGRTAW
jgi:hypothetical protein